MNLNRNLLVAAAVFASLPTLAQERSGSTEDGQLPEVVVTADKFEKSIQATSIAVTVVSGESISENGQTKLDDVLKNEPAVVVQGAALLTLRGDLRYATKQNVFPEAFAVPVNHPSVQKSYVTGDLTARAEINDALTLNAYVKNVNDRFIKQSHFFGYAQLAAPRTWGLTATYRF